MAPDVDSGAFYVKIKKITLKLLMHFHWKYYIINYTITEDYHEEI